MPRLTPVGASILAVTAIAMMLFIMNAANSAVVRWGAFVIAAAAVCALAWSDRSRGGPA